jgi:hypothetical protein
MPSIAANLRRPCSYPIVKVFGTAGQRCVTLNLGKSENQLWFETFRFQRSYICMNLLLPERRGKQFNGLKGLGAILAVAAGAFVAVALGIDEHATIGGEAVEMPYDSVISGDDILAPAINLGYQDETLDAAQTIYCNPVPPFTRKDDFQMAFLNHSLGESIMFFDCDGVRLYLPAPTNSESKSSGFTMLKIASIERAWKSLEENGIEALVQPRVVNNAGNLDFWIRFFIDRDGSPAAIVCQVPTSA